MNWNEPYISWHVDVADLCSSLKNNFIFINSIINYIILIYYMYNNYMQIRIQRRFKWGPFHNLVGQGPNTNSYVIKKTQKVRKQASKIMLEREREREMKMMVDSERDRRVLSSLFSHPCPPNSLLRIRKAHHSL